MSNDKKMKKEIKKQVNQKHLEVMYLKLAKPQLTGQINIY
jgi:hypothetical protein